MRLAWHPDRPPQPGDGMACHRCGDEIAPDVRGMTKYHKDELKERHWDICSPGWKADDKGFKSCSNCDERRDPWELKECGYCGLWVCKEGDCMEEHLHVCIGPVEAGLPGKVKNQPPDLTAGEFNRGE